VRFLETFSFLNDSATDTEAEYCDERVCLSVSVCVSVRDHIFGTTRPIFTYFKRVTCGRGSVLLWRRSDMLRISGFMDDKCKKT